MLPCRMSRDQRVQDNWAFLHAAEVASKTGSPVAVAFNLVNSLWWLPRASVLGIAAAPNATCMVLPVPVPVYFCSSATVMNFAASCRCQNTWWLEPGSLGSC